MPNNSFIFDSNQHINVLNGVLTKQVLIATQKYCFLMYCYQTKITIITIKGRVAAMPVTLTKRGFLHEH